MRDVSIIGIGQVKVGEHWNQSLSELGSQAIRQAVRHAQAEKIDALYVGNMLSGSLGGQEHLGAMLGHCAGLSGIEAFKIEAACGSSAAALRVGYMAVAGGLAEVVVVAGVEKMTDHSGEKVTAALAMASDGDYEAQNGLSFVALNALLMRRYMYEYGVKHEDFAPFAINAHKNAVSNPYAMFSAPITMEAFCKARMVADPVNLMDSSPVCDGAAAVVLCSTSLARSMKVKAVRIRACAVATDSVSLQERCSLLKMDAVERSAFRAMEQAKVTRADIDLFEAHDAFTIMTALSLEACGFAKPGRGVYLGREGEIALGGRIPISTYGGLKARGHPVGATGIYQVVELFRQLRGEAGENQVPSAHLGMAQNIGGSGATVTTTILESLD